MTDMTRQILSALEPYRNTKHGAGRFNTPWRSGADGGTLAVDEDRAYGLGLKWYDHKTQEGGNGFTLAQRLGIAVSERAASAAEPPAAYASLEHYARAHGLTAADLETYGWHEVRRGRGRWLAFAFPTDGGTRYRYADEGAAGRKYDHDKGTAATWYGLERATNMGAEARVLIICNGEISTIAAQVRGLPACAVTGGEKAAIPSHLLDQLIERVDASWRILIALDCDKQGRMSAQGQRRQLEAEGLRPLVVDLGGSHGFDLADFCRMRDGDLLEQLLERAQLEPRDSATTAPAREYVVGWQGGTTLAALQHKELPPECWIVEDILPAGAALLAAKPKARKSWLALNVALCVAMSQKLFGRYDVQAGTVLYLDLEGTQRRIKKRTRAMLGVERVQWPANFHIFTEWPQGEEALDQLEQWIIAHPDTRLVVIDVLADFRRPMEPKESMYGYDRETVKPINALAEKYNISILLVHHVNKARHDDIFDSISGTTGLPSAVGTMWVLGRNPEDPKTSVFAMRGRDLENDDPLALRWDDYSARHALEGKAAEVSVRLERKAILSLLEDDVPRSPKEIAQDLQRSVPSVQQLLGKMLNDGQVDKVGFGKYALVRGQSGQSGQSGLIDQRSELVAGATNSNRNSDLRERSELRSELVAGRQDAVNEAKNTNSDRSDRDHREHVARRTLEDVLAVVPEALRGYLTAYLQGERPIDAQMARDLCLEYGIDYKAARAAAREG